MLRADTRSSLTARIMKVGAALDDARRFLEAWDPTQPPQINLDRIRTSGALGKTRARSDDVLLILRRRFVAPGTHVVRTLQSLLRDPIAFREACYYEAARCDALLALFAQEPLFTWYLVGRRLIAVDEVVAWLEGDTRCPRWRQGTRRRVARGLLAALRDFGILEGAQGSLHKRITPPRLSLRGFLYVALREREQGTSDRALLTSPVWRRYLLAPSAVHALFLEADRLGLLRFAEAGTVVRVDWIIQRLEEVPDAPTT